MTFTYNNETLDSNLLMFSPEQKAFVNLQADRITSLEFKLQQSLREIERLMIKEK